MRKIKKLLLFLLGAVCMGLGVLGLFLPVLPTTPFILAAAWAFLRSSERVYHYIMAHPVYGPIVYNYRTHHGLTRSHKRRAILVLWGGIFLSVLLIDFWPAKLMLIAVAICGTLFMTFRLKTLEDKAPESTEQS